ncbi:MAG TPA: RluA family pseudouridine synthase, partial [Casimicrobiaceae bacterium]|nr:RluA family pseudouridine synthase [Casimicrobiaceae bacterium]
GARPDAAILLMTHSLALDRRLLGAVLAAGPRAYLGVLGPRHRTAALVEALALAPAALAGLRSPVGLDLGGDGPEAIALSIVYEDDDLLVIDKPVGLVVHPGAGNRSGTLLNALLHHAPSLATVPRAGIVHRLDKDTSGLMVVARTAEAQTSLVRQLASRTVARHYVALARGDLAKGVVVDAPIGRHPVHRTMMAVVERGKPARTHVDVVERFGSCTLVRCRLETGRTHQIRVHLAAIGHPLVGDPVYGGRGSGLPAALRLFPRQALHAERLELAHPRDGRRMAWTAPLPDDFAALLAVLHCTPPAPAPLA